MILVAAESDFGRTENYLSLDSKNPSYHLLDMIQHYYYYYVTSVLKVIHFFITLLQGWEYSTTLVMNNNLLIFSSFLSLFHRFYIDPRDEFDS